MIVSANTAQKRPGFLIILVGGTGLDAGVHVRPPGNRPLPFPTVVVHLDTDPITGPWVDVPIPIPMEPDKLEAVLADPALYGEVVRLFVEHHSRCLDAEDVQNGSRAIRVLSQLAFCCYLPRLQRRLRRAISLLRKQGACNTVYPVLVGCTGGGAGSALLILVARLLRDADVSRRLMAGFVNGELQTPIAFVTEPFAYTGSLRSCQEDMVLGNALGFHMECAELVKRNQLKYVFVQGLANAAGVVLDTPEDMALVLGTQVRLFVRHWPLIKAHLVNNVDTHRGTRRYAGADTPEKVLHLAPHASATGSGRASAEGPHSNGTAASGPTPLA